MTPNERLCLEEANWSTEQCVLLRSGLRRLPVELERHPGNRCFHYVILLGDDSHLGLGAPRASWASAWRGRCCTDHRSESTARRNRRASGPEGTRAMWPTGKGDL